MVHKDRNIKYEPDVNQVFTFTDLILKCTGSTALSPSVICCLSTLIYFLPSHGIRASTELCHHLCQTKTTSIFGLTGFLLCQIYSTETNKPNTSYICPLSTN
ncbi:hypothetical protein GOODEAATRI_026763 [Goodea atripinnis]|uniref:Uncharacterized protein n=1 Tax=Goodea atripinnis TaxID=208336 RepID=A0ABV0P827_9TELE